MIQGQASLLTTQFRFLDMKALFLIITEKETCQILPPLSLFNSMIQSIHLVNNPFHKTAHLIATTWKLNEFESFAFHLKDLFLHKITCADWSDLIHSHGYLLTLFPPFPYHSLWSHFSTADLLLKFFSNFPLATHLKIRDMRNWVLASQFGVKFVFS
jgi:hypothetical protein